MNIDALRIGKSIEKSERVDDNARKFVVDQLDGSLLESPGATWFVLTTDWLETEEASETKLAHKEFSNGDVQMLLIKKVTTDGKRKSEKRNITVDEYSSLRLQSVLYAQKTRHELVYTQKDTHFHVKYDVFTGSNLRMLEVDASSDEERGSFDPGTFPGKLIEVTGDVAYYGYRIAQVT